MDVVTRTVRAGLESDDVTGAVVPPIHLSSTYAFRGYGEKRQYDYSRSGNPTRDLLGNALADLEGGAARPKTTDRCRRSSHAAPPDGRRPSAGGLSA